MNFMRKFRDIEYIEVSRHIMKKHSKEEIEWIIEHSDMKLKEYYGEK